MMFVQKLKPNLLRIKAKPFNVSLLQVYAPTLAASEEETDELCSNYVCSHRNKVDVS